MVIGVGGFLGMGEHDIAVTMDKLKFVEEPVRTSSTTTTTRETTTGTATAPANTTATTTTRTSNANDWAARPCRDERQQGAAQGSAAVQIFGLQLS